jgi:molybdopterin converting factor subunit 1
MTIVVRLFAAARELAGRSEAAIDLPAEATVGDLRRELERQVPALAALTRRSLVAVNSEYASEDSRLSAADDVALIPPVSGG